MMLSLKPFKNHFQLSPLLHNSPSLLRPPSSILYQARRNSVKDKRFVIVRCTAGEEKKGERSFLSLEEAGLVEISGLSTHERFLCRLTAPLAQLNCDKQISSLNLLRVISEQEGLPIEELNAGRICDWFLKDKLKREQNFESSVLQWDDSDFPI